MALTDNLVSYWKLNESSGNAADSVWSNTWVNTNVTYDVGKINNCAIFNNTAYFTTALTIGTVFTVSFRAKYTSIADDIFIWNNKFNCGINSWAYVWKIKWDDNINETLRTTWATYNDWNWHHIVCICNSWVVNGSYLIVDWWAETVTWTITTSSSTWNTIIWANSALNYKFTGNLDEIWVRSRVLTSQEVTKLWNWWWWLTHPFNQQDFFNIL